MNKAGSVSQWLGPLSWEAGCQLSFCSLTCDPSQSLSLSKPQLKIGNGFVKSCYEDQTR